MTISNPFTAPWGELEGRLAAAEKLLLTAAPDATCAAEINTYLMRTLTSSLSGMLLGQQLTKGGLTRALPTCGFPNPDYRIHTSPIEPAGRYLLTGSLNDSERIGVGLYTLGKAGEVLLSGYRAFDHGNAGETFSLLLAADASEPGLEIKPDCRLLIIRVLHRQPAGVPATLSLEGTTAPSRLTADQALPLAGQSLLRDVGQFLEWSRLCAAHPNQMVAPPAPIAAAAQGDANTTYGFGYFLLADGQRLEVTVPASLPGYWSLHAYTHWGEVLPGSGIHDLSGKPEPDGHIRIQIGPEPPTQADNGNWLDTQGRRRGVLLFRAVGNGPLGLPSTTLGESGL